jgi:hypothetical protein
MDHMSSSRACGWAHRRSAYVECVRSWAKPLVLNPHSGADQARRGPSPQESCDIVG